MGRVRRSTKSVAGSSIEVDRYIASAPAPARAKLSQVRGAILDVAPNSSESISYRMPYYSYRGRLAWFGLHKDYVGLYLRPPIVEEFRDALKGYVTTKSAVHLPLDRKIPVALVRKLVKARVAMNERERPR